MKDWVFLVSLGLVILFIMFGPVLMMSRSEKRADCINAGYAGYVRFAKQPICVGVVGGEWQIEPLDDVRARLEGE